MRLVPTVFTLAFVLMALGVSASHAEPVLREDVAVDAVGKAFQKAAEGFNLPGYGIVKNKCAADVRAVCTYDLPGNQSLMAGAADAGGPVEELTLIFAKDGDATALIFNAGILLAVADPAATADERGAILSTLMSAVTDMADKEAFTENVRFSSTVSPVIGFWIFAAPRDK